MKLWQLYYYHNDPQKWITVITQTRWYEQIGILLTEASRIVHKISHLVHVTLLAELEARGAQLSVLVQILLFP